MSNVATPRYVCTYTAARRFPFVCIMPSVIPARCPIENFSFFSFHVTSARGDDRHARYPPDRSANARDKARVRFENRERRWRTDVSYFRHRDCINLFEIKQK
ncbi:hypothetical protein PUN28_015497 [Cardiocondyla obscurior]|uniref:Uncharacterized protein n=1 Tax=Cardiocondyla obscurior TaxID=286306 RepID=A0AAW2EYC1_9HYME